MRFDGEKRLRKRVEKLADILESGGEHQKLKFHIGVSIATDKEIPQKHEHGKWATRIEHFYNHACFAIASIQEQEDRRVALFDSRLLEQHLWNNKIEEMMEDSLKNNEFKIYLQAKYSPSGEKLMGAEALVRWVNNENGVITPDSFIPIIEQNGFITKLDDYMISGVAGLIPHNTIEFELTESAFFDDKRRIIETVKELQSNGFSVSMDDFGSGYFFAKPEPVKEFESRHLQKIQKI
ncbi:MAG: EAL domain-containing protein [Lachnospiraceae bacterium]|nr:EAL domain-containing protein [Lachnospiraceae bacterium]